MENIIRGTLESSVEDGFRFSISIHHPLDPKRESLVVGLLYPIIGYEPVSNDSIAQIERKDINCKE